VIISECHSLPKYQLQGNVVWIMEGIREAKRIFTWSFAPLFPLVQFV